MKKLGFSLFAIMLILTGCSSTHSNVTSRTELPELGFDIKWSDEYIWLQTDTDIPIKILYESDEDGDEPLFVARTVLSDDDSVGLMIEGTGEYSCWSRGSSYDGSEACESTYLELTEIAKKLVCEEQFYAALSVFENETGVDVVYE